jgi:hypothetical protein
MNLQPNATTNENEESTKTNVKLPAGVPVDRNTKTMSDKIKKKLFHYTKLEDSESHVADVLQTVEECNGIVRFSFDTNEEFPEKYNLAVLPINRKYNGKSHVQGVTIGAVPSVDLLMETDVGKEWVFQQAERQLQVILANAARPDDKGNLNEDLPLSVASFIESSSGGREGVLVAYNTLAPRAIKALKDLSAVFKGLDVKTLRQLLQASEFAERFMPKVKQAFWEKVLDNMLDECEKEDLNPGMLAEWRKTRDTAGLPEVQEVDENELDNLFATLDE